LRDEYKRTKGIFINKSRGERESLKQFWKDYISETYKKNREKMAALAKS
jgi:cytoplasmic iron level regulating protein YaaA (DUF328/UPF0246 family)